MKQFEVVLGRILSVAILIGGIALVFIWRQQEHLHAVRVGLTEADARNTTLLLLIPGLLMIGLGLINLMPGSLRPKPGSAVEIMLKKLFSVIILLGGIALVVLWTMQQQVLMSQINVSEHDARIPTLLLFIPGTLFIGLGVVNLLPDSLRGVHHAPEAAPSVENEQTQSAVSE